MTIRYYAKYRIIPIKVTHEGRTMRAYEVQTKYSTGWMTDPNGPHRTYEEAERRVKELSFKLNGVYYDQYGARITD